MVESRWFPELWRRKSWEVSTRIPECLQRWLLLNWFRVDVSWRAVVRTLNRSDLWGHHPRTLLFDQQHIKARLKFTLEHVKHGSEFWKCVLSSDDTKLVLFGCCFCLKNEGRELQPTKHSSYNEMWWWEHDAVRLFDCLKHKGLCSCASLAVVAARSSNKTVTPSSKFLQNCLKASRIKALVWTSQSLDLHHVEKMWRELKN